MERCSPGHSEILHPESPFIKNTLPKPPFITQACAFNPSGVDLSEVLNNKLYTHTHHKIRKQLRGHMRAADQSAGILSSPRSKMMRLILHPLFTGIIN